MEYIKNIKAEDTGICKNAGSFLQSSEWAEFKSRFGWKPAAFMIEWDSCGSTALMTLSRRLFPGFSFTYIPWGPKLPENFPAEKKACILEELSLKLKPLIAHDNIFIRYEPLWSEENHDKKNLIKRASVTVQPPDTVIISLDSAYDEILDNMKPKWRYNIFLSGRKGVEVKCVRDIDAFYELLKETALRDGITVHSINYYKTLFEIYDETRLRLYTACHEGDMLAAIVVLLYEETATYLYGASSGKKRNLMAAYALQWKAIQDAKEAGCRSYDFFGIPPCDDPDHPMAGLYRFKTGFGGKIVHRTGAWDYPLKTAFYYIFSIAERIRKNSMNRKKRKNRIE